MELSLSACSITPVSLFLYIPLGSVSRLDLSQGSGAMGLVAPELYLSQVENLGKLADEPLAINTLILDSGSVC